METSLWFEHARFRDHPLSLKRARLFKPCVMNATFQTITWTLYAFDQIKTPHEMIRERSKSWTLQKTTTCLITGGQ
jgi:hypothetical protein